MTILLMMCRSLPASLSHVRRCTRHVPERQHRPRLLLPLHHHSRHQQASGEFWFHEIWAPVISYSQHNTKYWWNLNTGRVLVKCEDWCRFIKLKKTNKHEDLYFITVDPQKSLICIYIYIHKYYKEATSWLTECHTWPSVWQVQGNVCYKHLGHGVFIEDSVEQDNIIERNLIIGTMHGTRLMSDSTIEWCQEDYPNNNFGENCE